MTGVPANCEVQGFEITNTGANQLTVTTGQCLDSSLSRTIAVTGSTILTLETTHNKLVTIAAVILNNETHTCKVYDSEAAMAADVGVNITHFAYLSPWQNNGSGQVKAGRSFGAGDGLAELWWMKASENAVISATAPPAHCGTPVSLESYLPSSDRVISILPGGRSTTTKMTCIGVDGWNVVCGFHASASESSDNNHSAWFHTASAKPEWIPLLHNTIFWGDGTDAGAGNVTLLLHATRFRR